METSHLARLLESGEYERCLEAAAALLEEGEQDRADQARIYAAVCRSCLSLTDYAAAVEAGRSAVALAGEFGPPDVLGSALVDLATALAKTRRHREALATFDRYLEGLQTYTAARCLEGTALTRRAELLERAGKAEQAAEDLVRARRWFERFGDDAGARACGHALIRICLASGDTGSAAAILAAHDEFARANPTERAFLTVHLLDRARFHCETGSLELAAAEAFQALEEAEEPELQCRAHLLLCRIARAQEKPADAFAFAFAARVAAIDGRLYGTELEATKLLLALMEAGDGNLLLQQMDEAFAEAGVDIGDYIPDEIARTLPSRD